MLFLRTETVEVMYSYTYDDCDDVFERSPLIAYVRDLTTTRTYVSYVICLCTQFKLDLHVINLCMQGCVRERLITYSHIHSVALYMLCRE